MKQSTMEAYAEVDEILKHMDKQYFKKIPEKLIKIFEEKKDNNYSINISWNKPLKEQPLKKETLSLLAVLNYNYWCNDANKKEALIKKYTENEIKHQEELRRKYNPDNIFKIENNNQKVENNINTASMIRYKESLFSKITKKMKSIFGYK